MKKVAIVMGSDSDLPVAQKAVDTLKAFGVPCLCVDPGNGGFARVVMGMSGQGVDIYVPESLYDDAVALSKEENNEEL